MKKHRESQKDIVLVSVNGYRVRGKLIKTEDGIVTVKVPTYYRDGFIEVKANVNDIEKVKCDIGDCKSY